MIYRILNSKLHTAFGLGVGGGQAIFDLKKAGAPIFKVKFTQTILIKKQPTRLGLVLKFSSFH